MWISKQRHKELQDSEYQHVHCADKFCELKEEIAQLRKQIPVKKSYVVVHLNNDTIEEYEGTSFEFIECGKWLAIYEWHWPTNIRKMMIQADLIDRVAMVEK